MPADIALLIGVLAGCAVHLIMCGSFVRLLFGFALLSHTVNLILIGTAGEPSVRRAPLLEAAGTSAMVDPLPQALVLTAIVINFAVTAFLVILLYRIFLDAGTTTARELYGPGRKRPSA